MWSMQIQKSSFKESIHLKDSNSIEVGFASFEKGSTPKGKNLLHIEANSFCLE